MRAAAMVGLSQRQKAAALVMAVGADRAAPVLGHLSEEEQETLALEVAHLGEVEADQMESVLEEFCEEATARGHIVSGSLDAARDLLRRTRGDDADEVIERLVATVRVTPFRFLRDRDPGEVAQYLSEEHPQTIALVLSHLPASLAAQILAGFEPEAQRDVAMRVATLGPATPEAVHHVEDALKRRLGDVKGQQRRGEDDGIRDLVSILNSSDRGTERVILASLEESDPTLADQIRELMFVFEDIIKLDDRALQRVLREIEQETLVYALKGVTDEVVDKVMRNISERAATALVEEREVVGPVRTSDVERAQSAIVGTIRQLEQAGDILVRRSADGGDVIE